MTTSRGCQWSIAYCVEPAADTLPSAAVKEHDVLGAEPMHEPLPERSIVQRLARDLVGTIFHSAAAEISATTPCPGMAGPAAAVVAVGVAGAAAGWQAASASAARYVRAVIVRAGPNASVLEQVLGLGLLAVAVAVQRVG